MNSEHQTMSVAIQDITIRVEIGLIVAESSFRCLRASNWLTLAGAVGCDDRRQVLRRRRNILHQRLYESVLGLQPQHRVVRALEADAGRRIRRQAAPATTSTSRAANDAASHPLSPAASATPP